MSSDIFFMRRALRLAVLGSYNVSPNPMVGAVLVKNGKVISQGFHARYGSAHAEVEAIGMARESVEGASLYVSLEPCDHIGNTASCSDFIISKKIKKVFIATTDTNPLVAGKGIKKLIGAGVEVEVGLLEREARLLNEGFFRRHEASLPRVCAKIGMSFDGKIALDNGTSKWITNELAREDVQRLRARCDAILVGKNTILADDPQMNVRSHIKRRDTDRQPLKVVFDKNLELNLDHMIFQTGKILIVHSCEKTSKDTHNITYLKEDRLVEVLRYLAIHHRVNNVLVESGAGLLSAFLRDGLVDELITYQAPMILGSSRSSISLELDSIDRAIRLYHIDMKSFGNNIRFNSRLTYANKN